MIDPFKIDIQISSQGVFIACDDPLIVRADQVVCNRPNKTITAVIDGVMADLGGLSDQLMAQLVRQDFAQIRAAHFSGGYVSRRVPLIAH